MPDQCLPAPAFSAWSLFLQADLVIKAVMIGLIMTSVWSWTVMVSKWIALRRLHRIGDLVLERIRTQGGVDILNHPIQTANDPFSYLLSLASREWRQALGQPWERVLQRLQLVMGSCIEEQRIEVRRSMGFLSSVSNIAPFVGLFGTVWGVIHSISNIAVIKNASFPVVAGGIAEALLATALGLAVAIPASVGYTKLSMGIGEHIAHMERFCGELCTLFLQNDGGKK